MKTVPLHGPAAAGRVALVDDEDYGLVMQYKWRPKKESHTTYAMTTVPGTRNATIKMHQIIMGANGVDHRNRDGLDNRRSNLRPATVSQNAMNKKRCRRPTVSGFKGVAWRHDRSKWFARIYLDGRQIYLGMYDSAQEAARAYDTAARDLFGEFARLNFPEEAACASPRSPTGAAPTGTCRSRAPGHRSPCC